MWARTQDEGLRGVSALVEWGWDPHARNEYVVDLALKHNDAGEIQVRVSGGGFANEDRSWGKCGLIHPEYTSTILETDPEFSEKLQQAIVEASRKRTHVRVSMEFF